MYIRWKRRPVGANRAHAESPWNEQHLDVVLARSERVDGKPRQRVVKYLGTIRESYIAPYDIANDDVRARAINAKGWFWHRVSSALAETDMTPAERERAETTIAARVPRISEDQRAERDAGAAVARAQLAQMGIRV